MAGETPQPPPPDEPDRAKLEADLAAAEAANAEAQVASAKAAVALAQIAGKRGGALKTTAKVEPAADQEKDADAKQKWWLRYVVAFFVLVTLWLELAGIMLLLLLQGFGSGGLVLGLPLFKLNDWVIGAVVSGVFVQTLWCLHNIASHLFPEGVEKLKQMLAALKGSEGK